MFAVIDALTGMVAEELPRLIYAEPSEAQVREVSKRLFEDGLADVETSTILTAARELGLTAATETVPGRPEVGFSQNLFAVLKVAEVFPLSLTELDRLISALCAEHMQLSLDGRELAAAARGAGFALRSELAALDASF